MKTVLKVLVAIGALGVVILVGLHLFLQYGLTKAMREVVLPRVEQELGIDVRVGNLSLNMVGGSFDLERVDIRNPEGFTLENLASVDRVYVEVDVMSLLKRGVIMVKQIRIGDARINVVRNKKGDINIAKFTERLPQPAKQSEVEPTTDVADTSTTQQPPDESVPPPELLIEKLQCDVMLRYLDFQLDQFEIILALSLEGNGVSTLQDPSTPWGDVLIVGSLGDDRTSFVTELKMKMAPITNPQTPSFDLTGRIMEIDPRLLEDIYEKAGIQSAPFGLEPNIQCRKGLFENSAVAMSVREIKLEEKLADRLGGMASIGTLRFSIPVQGSLQKPVFNISGELLSAIGGNTKVIMESFLKGVVAKEAGLDKPPENIKEAAVGLLAEKVDEIGESETLKKVIVDLTDGKPADTNAPASAVIVDLLGEKVDEIGESEEIKKELKNLGKFLFGK